jgi:hypothetical protein
MTIIVTLEGRVEMTDVTGAFKLKKLILRTEGDELAWELCCSYRQEGSHRHCKFLLIPIHGMDFCRTLSFKVTPTVVNGSAKATGSWKDVGQSSVFSFGQSRSEIPFGEFLTATVEIQLKWGQVTCVGNSNRLYNSPELSDITLKCGDLVLSGKRCGQRFQLPVQIYVA